MSVPTKRRVPVLLNVYDVVSVVSESLHKEHSPKDNRRLFEPHLRILISRFGVSL